MFVRFTVGSKTFVVTCIGGVYLPPLSSTVFYEAHISSVEHLLCQYRNDTFIICGDYNMLDISWDNDDNGLIYTSASSVL